jgi:hypothetical protein
MCLEHITSRVTPEEQNQNKRIIYAGFKIFRKDKFSNIFSFMHKSRKMAIGAWLKEEAYRPTESKDVDTVGTWGRHYPNGWHIFTDESEANRILNARQRLSPECVLRLVKYKGVHTLGTEKGDERNRYPVHVAVCTSMLVMPLQKKTTPQGTLKPRKTAPKKKAVCKCKAKKAVTAKRGGRDAKRKH